MLRLPDAVRMHFSETWGLCASRALVNFLRPPGGGRRCNTYQRCPLWPIPGRKA